MKLASAPQNLGQKMTDREREPKHFIISFTERVDVGNIGVRGRGSTTFLKMIIAVLRIRDVHPVSRTWFLPIPDPGSQHQKRGGGKNV
jgi:hypothetical protein